MNKVWVLVEHVGIRRVSGFNKSSTSCGYNTCKASFTISGSDWGSAIFVCSCYRCCNDLCTSDAWNDACICPCFNCYSNTRICTCTHTFACIGTPYSSWTTTSKSQQSTYLRVYIAIKDCDGGGLLVFSMLIVGWCEQPRVYLRGTWLSQQIHSILSPAGVRASKRVDQLLEEFGVMFSCPYLLGLSLQIVVVTFKRVLI